MINNSKISQQKDLDDSTKSLNGMCQSCMMPFNNDPESASRESEIYCNYCFKDGMLCYPGNDVKQFKKAMVDSMVEQGETKLNAKLFALIAGSSPSLKK